MLRPLGHATRNKRASLLMALSVDLRDAGSASMAKRTLEPDLLRTAHCAPSWRFLRCMSKGTFPPPPPALPRGRLYQIFPRIQIRRTHPPEF
jgi:hypothetical protein